MNDGRTRSDEKGYFPGVQSLPAACAAAPPWYIACRGCFRLSVSIWSTNVLRCRPSLALERSGGCREQAVPVSQGGRLALALSTR